MIVSAAPHQYPRRILLAVAVSSPQVVTETLYALSQQVQPAYVPTEIHVITTNQGLAAVAKLADGKVPGKISQFCADYDVKSPQFDPSHIHIIKDNLGKPLNDIRNREEHNHAADLIMQVVQWLTADPDSCLIASLSDGRRSMTYYMGYALTLFGRYQDRLTHVLIDDEYFFQKDFYYPTPQPSLLPCQGKGTFDASQVEVTLADIPFLRLCDGLPDRLLDGETCFSSEVLLSQKKPELPKVILKYGQPSLCCGSKTISMRPADLAFYAWFLERRAAGKAPLHWSDAGLAEEFLKVYAKLFGNVCSNYERAETSLIRGMSKEYFESRKSRTNSALKKSLNKKEARYYLIDAFGKRPMTRFGLNIDISAIQLH